jgi:transposase InsO family protein
VACAASGSGHNLLTKHDRLLRLERSTAERKTELRDEQIRLLGRFSPEFRERHIETPHTGALVGVDTFFVGALKGVGKVYLQTAIDCHSRYAWARLQAAGYGRPSDERRCHSHLRGP